MLFLGTQKDPSASLNCDLICGNFKKEDL